MKEAIENVPRETLAKLGLNPDLEKGKLQFRLAMNLLGNGPNDEQKKEAVLLLNESANLGCQSARKTLEFPFIRGISPVSEEKTEEIYTELKEICKLESLDKTMSKTDFDRAMETRSPKVIKSTKAKNVLKMVGGSAVSVLAYALAIPFGTVGLFIALGVLAFTIIGYTNSQVYSPLGRSKLKL